MTQNTIHTMSSRLQHRHCICHERHSHLFAIGTFSYNVIDRGIVHFLQDNAPYNRVHQHFLKPLEQPVCCSVVHLKDVKSFCRFESYIALGTAFTVSKQFEPTTGRILVFRCNDSPASVPTIIMTAETDGAVYDISSMRASYLVCAVNHAVHVYSVSSELRHRASYDGLIVALKVRCCGNLIIIGDMMRSITILKFNFQPPDLVEIARDYNANWTCALEAFTDGSLLIAEASGNLVALKRCYNGSNINHCLESRARMHFGDAIVCFARGSFTTQNDWPNIKDASASLLFGCVFLICGVWKRCFREISH